MKYAFCQNEKTNEFVSILFKNSIYIFIVYYYFITAF